MRIIILITLLAFSLPGYSKSQSCLKTLEKYSLKVNQQSLLKALKASELDSNHSCHISKYGQCTKALNECWVKLMFLRYTKKNTPPRRILKFLSPEGIVQDQAPSLKVKTIENTAEESSVAN